MVNYRIYMSEGRCCLNIGGRLTGDQVDMLREALLPAVAHCCRVEVDLSGITAFDAEGFDFLLHVRQVAGSRLQFHAVSSRAGQALLAELECHTP